MFTVHKVSQGECLNTIARNYGFKDGDSIYQHPDNQQLRQLRPDPNSLLPGDKITIPEQEKSEVSVTSGQKCRFIRFKPTTKILRLQLDDKSTNKFSNQNYELKIQLPAGCKGDYQIYNGKLDDQACLEQEIPVAAVKGLLIIKCDGQPVKVRILIDHLDPADEISGMQARLKNLGFDPGPIDGKAGPRTNDALHSYQKYNNFQVGEANSQTITHLKDQHQS